MDPYRVLRQSAATKRDTAIAEARRVYRKDIVAIEALERSVPPQLPKLAVPKEGPNTVELITRLIPKDKPFTIAEMMHWLHDASGKSYNEPTVRTYVSRLCNRGVIRKLYKTGQNYALWIASESHVEEGPIETRSLHEVVAQVLVEEGPRTVVEIVVGMRQRGYRTDATPEGLARAVRDMLKRYRGKFVRGKSAKYELAGE